MSNVFFEVMPNWLFDVNMKYRFETALTMKRRKAEQRKALRDLPIRILSFTITDNEKHSLIWNYLISIHASSIYMPLYNEPCKPDGVGSLTGETSVVIQNDISNYYNLRHMTARLVIIDLLEAVDSEILTLERVNRNINELEFSAIGGAFLRESSIIFPLSVMYLTNKDRTDYSDTMSGIKLEFTEC